MKLHQRTMGGRKGEVDAWLRLARSAPVRIRARKKAVVMMGVAWEKRKRLEVMKWLSYAMPMAAPAPEIPNRIERMCDLLKRLWERNPELRLGQLLMNLTKPGTDIFYTPDQALLATLKRAIEDESWDFWARHEDPILSPEELRLLRRRWARPREANAAFGISESRMPRRKQKR